MKKFYNIILVCIIILAACSCSCKKEEEKNITFSHYVRGGGVETLDFNILWKYSNDTFTKYQVAYTSYVCSDPSVNYINVMYIELTNKGSSEDSIIREISFSTVENSKGEVFDVGLWGDYKTYLGKNFYEGIEGELLPKLKYMNYEEISSLANKGYKNYTHIDGINVDAVTNGTISASNVVSIVKAIFDYHIDTHY